MPVCAVVTAADPAAGLWPYLLDMMASEGLPRPAQLEVGRLAAAPLAEAGAVVVPALELTPEASLALATYVRGGGTLLALRPCPALAQALGLHPAEAPAAWLTQDAYLECRRPHPLLAPIPDDIEYLQYHGPADLYLPPAGASVAATIYWGGVSNPYPAILSGSLGRGRYVIFTYDLALSTMLFHQGLKSQSSLGARADLSGDNTYTPNDLFVGYLDPERRLIPQADLQQRMLSRAVEGLLEERLPLPRFWYFPNDKPAIALIDGDSDAMTLDEMRLYADTTERAGGRYTLYLMQMQYGDVSPEVMAGYRRRGHDFGPHLWLDLRPTPQAFHENVQRETAAFAARYGFRPTNTRHHCVVWPGWVEPALALRQAGIGMEVNFRAAQHYREGYITGSGQPTPYVTEAGELVEVYQQPTLLSDDFLYQNKSHLRPLKSEEVVSLTRRVIDESIALYHTVVHPYFHPVYARTDKPLVPGTWTLPWLEATVTYCRERGIEMPAVGDWFRFTRARRRATIDAIAAVPEMGTLRFAVQPGEGCDWPGGLTVVVPAAWAGKRFAAVTQVGERLPFAQQRRAGGDYATFAPEPGEVVAQYE